MKSKVRALALGTICAIGAAAVLNQLSCIGACEPAQGPAGAFQLPLAVLYTLLTAAVVLPLSVTLHKVGSVVAPAVVSCLAAAAATWLFYRPDVDTLLSLVIPFGFFFAPWFIGGYVFVRMWPNKRFQGDGPRAARSARP